METINICSFQIYQQKVVERSGLDEPAAPPAEGGIITKAVTYDNNVAPNGGTFFDNIFNVSQCRHALPNNEHPKHN